MTAKRTLLVLIGVICAALVTLRENAIDFKLSLTPQSHLQMEVYGATLDWGAVPPDQDVVVYNFGQQVRRSPIVLLRRSGIVSELRDIFTHYRIPANETPTIKVSRSEIEHGVWFRFWNPSGDVGLDLRLTNGQGLGGLRLHLHECAIEVHIGSQHDAVFHPPLVNLIVASLSFAFFSAWAVVLVFQLLWLLAPSFGRGQPRTMPALRYQVLLVFILGTLWIAYVRFGVFLNLYGFGDEMNYLVQARVLATGHVALPQPEHAEFFRVFWMDLMNPDGKLWNFHPVGNSILLAIGVLIGCPGVIPALVGGGIFATLFLLAEALVGSTIFAWLCVLVAASSHYIITLAGSFMAHGPALLCVELATLMLVRFWQTRRERYVVWMGAAFGAAFVMRPASAALAGVVPAVVILVALFRRRVRVRTVILAVLVAAAIASVEYWRVYETTGQFALGYMVKGPEAGSGLPERWARGWEWRLKNTYLNYRYYHNRIFGLGFAGNLLLFFVPLALCRAPWVCLAYAAVLIFWIGHSFMQFYGWMWEPRMLYEFSHLTVLLSAYGMWLLITRSATRERINPIAMVLAIALTGAFLANNYFYDLPDRFRNEYWHYNVTDPTIRDQIRSQGIRNAIILYDNMTNGFAPRLAENEIVFKGGVTRLEGNVIHAIHLGWIKDYALISDYPDRTVYFSPDNRSLKEVPTFYHDALPALRKLVATDVKVSIGIPWLAFANPKSLDDLRGARLFDDSGFADALQSIDRPTILVLTAEMMNFAKAVHAQFASVLPIPVNSVYPMSILQVDPSSRRSAMAPGFQMKVYKIEEAPCKGTPLSSGQVGLVAFDAMDKQNMCVEWHGEFRLTDPVTYGFALESDDGSGLIIDGQTVVDNHMFKDQGKTRREGQIHLAPGLHTITVNYVQLGGPAFFDVQVRRNNEPYHPLTMVALDGVVYPSAPPESEPEADPSPPPVAPTPIFDPSILTAALPTAPGVPVAASELRVSSFRADPLMEKEAIDEFSGSRWDTGRPQRGDDEWFRIDLPGVGELSHLRLRTTGLDYPRRLDVQVSTDGRTFTHAATVEGNGPDTDVVFQPPVRCQAIRLEQKGHDPTYFWAINDLIVWGDFPKRVRHWWDVSYLGVGLSLLTVVLVGGWAMPRGGGSGGPRRLSGTGWAVTAVSLFAAFLLATQHHYGETWDEFEHFENGEEYYQYLFGTHVRPPIWGDLFRKYYGPFSDVVATALKHCLHDGLGWLSVESAIHLHLLLFFALSGLLLFVVIRSSYGVRAAWFCLIAYFASPHLLGHCHNNMKDFAVTAWTVIAVFSFYAAAERQSYRGMALAGLLTGMALATKINAVILAPIFLVYTLLFVIVQPRLERLRFAVVGCGVVHWAMAVSAMILLWPWLWDAPYIKFLSTVRFFQHHIWTGNVLYKGRLFLASQIPRDYAPYYVLITTPLLWLPFAALGLIRAAVELLHRRLLPILIVLAFCAPIATEVFTHVPIYDGVRHFLPAFPFLACLVGLGLDWSGKRVALAAAVIVLGAGIVNDARLHPYESVYFNALVGGGRGAMGSFELDYWGNSLKEAGRWVNEHASPQSRVRVILGLVRLTQLRPDLVAGTDTDPDYAIVLNRESLAANPYHDRTPIYEVTADGAVLTRVYHLTAN